MIKHYIFLILFFTNASYAACFDKYKRFDPSCDCQIKNTCFKTNGTVDKKIQKVDFAASGKSKKLKKTFNYLDDHKKTANALFSGQLIFPRKEQIEELKKKNEKIVKVNKRLMKSYLKYEKKTKPKYTIAQQQNYVTKVYNRVKKSLKNTPMSFDGLFEKLGIKKVKSFKVKSSGLALGTMTKDYKSKNHEPEVALIDDKKESFPKGLSKEEFNRAQAERDAMKILKKKYKVKNLLTKNQSIFKALSYRYQVIHKRKGLIKVIDYSIDSETYEAVWAKIRKL